VASALQFTQNRSLETGQLLSLDSQTTGSFPTSRCGQVRSLTKACFVCGRDVLQLAGVSEEGELVPLAADVEDEDDE